MFRCERLPSSLPKNALGCILVTVPQIETSDNKVGDNNAAGFVLGVLAVLVEVLLSGFASIYFEKVVKASDEKLTVWDRNFQLALHSILLYVFYGCFERNFVSPSKGPYRPLHDFSMYTWSLVLLGGGGGLLVALTVRVADSIVKTLATSLAIVTSTLASHVLLSGPLDLQMGVGALVVSLAVLNYSFDATPHPVASK